MLHGAMYHVTWIIFFLDIIKLDVADEHTERS